MPLTIGCSYILVYPGRRGAPVSLGDSDMDLATRIWDAVVVMICPLPRRSQHFYRGLDSSHGWGL